MGNLKDCKFCEHSEIKGKNICCWKGYTETMDCGEFKDFELDTRIKKLFDKLAEYEALEAKGLLVRLPCKDELGEFWFIGETAKEEAEKALKEKTE